MISRTGQPRRGPRMEQIIPEQELDPTKFYIIRSLSNGFCLREELKSYKFQEGDKVRVIGGDPADQLLSFLWMVRGFEEDNQKNEKMLRYQIIHACTNLNLLAQDNECHLTEQIQPYYFTLQPVKKGGFRIKDQDDGYLNLEGILETAELADKDANQEFYFEAISPDRVKQLLGTFFILTKKKIYALNLNISFEQSEQQIILSPLNYRMNQRWFFMKVEPEKEDLNIRASIDNSQNGTKYKVYIRNVLTEQFMSFNKQKRRLVQSSYPEEWYITQSREEVGMFTIRHVKQNLFLNYNYEHRLRLASEVCEWFIPQSRSILEHSYKIAHRRSY